MFGPNDGINSSPVPEPSVGDVDASRTREITAKAATGIILLMLKWFKVSRKSWLTYRYYRMGADLSQTH